MTEDSLRAREAAEEASRQKLVAPERMKAQLEELEREIEAYLMLLAEQSKPQTG